MKTIDEVGERLCASITRLLVPLQTERRLHADVFEDLDRAAKDLERLLRASEALPRKLMNEIYVTLTILRMASTSPRRTPGKYRMTEVGETSVIA